MKTLAKPFALCIDNTGYQSSLVAGKVYRMLPDPIPLGCGQTAPLVVRNRPRGTARVLGRRPRGLL
jgi:hypothetical protein